jgi:hypothetical protein
MTRVRQFVKNAADFWVKLVESYAERSHQYVWEHVFRTAEEFELRTVN